MFPQSTKNHFISITFKRIIDIQNRVGLGVAWGLTSQHRQFIDLLESDDGNITFEQWKKAVKSLMQFHAIARNDIYDYSFDDIKADAEGYEQADFETVSREEAEVRLLLHTYHAEYGREEE